MLYIIENASRATVEEQDDTIVWLAHAMNGADVQPSVLLRGNAVNYAAAGQTAPCQTQSPRIADDVAGLIARGVPVFVVGDDLDVRGIARADLIRGIERIDAAGLADLMRAHDKVWHW